MEGQDVVLGRVWVYLFN